MPGTPKPTVDPRYGSHWTPVIQALHFGQSQQNQANAARPQGSILDQYGNTVELWGSNLSQNVTIGASFGNPGVQVGTGIASGTAGRAYQQALATGKITTTATPHGGSPPYTATFTQPAGSIGTFATGMTIGAADVTDPLSGTPAPVLTPGTTILGISGSTVTLSLPLPETASDVFCAACFFVPEIPGGWQTLTLTSGIVVPSGYYKPSARIEGDTVRLAGTMQNTSGSTISGVLATLPSASLYPTGNVLLANESIYITAGTGGLDYPSGLANNGVVGLDGLSFILVGEG